MSLAQTLSLQTNTQGLTPYQVGGDHFANATVKAIKDGIAQLLKTPDIEHVLPRDIKEGLSWVAKTFADRSENDPTKPLGKPTGRSGR